MLIRAFLLMQSAWSTLRQREIPDSWKVEGYDAIRMEHAEAKDAACADGLIASDAIRMEHAEAKGFCPTAHIM